MLRKDLTREVILETETRCLDAVPEVQGAQKGVLRTRRLPTRRLLVQSGVSRSRRRMSEGGESRMEIGSAGSVM